MAKCFFRGNENSTLVYSYMRAGGALFAGVTLAVGSAAVRTALQLAHCLTENREEAEDVVQETYAKALKRFSPFEECRLDIF
jgi:hypothetical protein